MDGTDLKSRALRENRYLDWEQQHSSNPEHLHNLSTFTLIPKQMSLEQLRSGAYWLLWRLYDPDAFIRRLQGFFSNYDHSLRWQGLLIPQYGFDRKRLGILFRLLKFLAGASRGDRKAFFDIFRTALASSHPQRIGIAVLAFITLVNTREFLLSREPGIAAIAYPA